MTAEKSSKSPLSRFLGVFRYSAVAMRIVWDTSAPLMIAMALTTLIVGLLPAAIASVGGLFVDAVAGALGSAGAAAEVARSEALTFVYIEVGLVLLMTAAQQANTVCQAVLRVLLGNKINVMILEKALTLELAHFEDAEYYDKLVRARREASSRPLSLVTKTFDLLRNVISLIAIGVKEVKLLQLGKIFLQRYVDIFLAIYKEDRSLVLRRGVWGYGLGIIASGAFYFAYGWVGFAAIAGAITIGQMTMYIAQFRLGQSAVTSSLTSVNGMYEDNLYLSNLTEYLEHEVPEQSGNLHAGPRPEDGIRFENVSFFYPGSDVPALDNVNLHITPGESLAIVGENGSGKTTLIKLLTRLYTPTQGQIMLEGLPLQEWDVDTLRRKIGVIFQDFARYQLIVGENIGIGDSDNLASETEIEIAAKKGMADEFVRDLPSGYKTQLGTWFKDGKELSGGQWQKVALSRAFMRSKADILILDEPTAAIDAKAEADIFAHFAELTANRISIIISHRFSTVRRADHIIVLEKSKIMEQGSHEELLELGGQYATLFMLQAEGYQ